jgi:preprotein translocase subunit SecB
MADQPGLQGVDFAMKPPGGDFNIRKIYVKDLSFETPHSPAVFSSEWKPDADVNLRTAVLALDPGDYEVTLSITATVKVGERTAFLAEVSQSGIFHIVGLTQAELEPVVGAYCPAILYPYAREVVSDLVMRGGFPPFVLSPVNFDALYEHQRVKATAPQAPEPDPDLDPG